MAHIHSIYDTDPHYSINPKTRVLANKSESKLVLVQYDHNSERITFELPRLIDGHDMSQCNVVRIHFCNVDSATKKAHKGVYEVTDLQLSPEDENIVICSWLISRDATQLVGVLSFVLEFSCVVDDVVEYAWHTAVSACLTVSTGIDNTGVIVEEYPDILGKINAMEEATQAAQDAAESAQDGWKRVNDLADQLIQKEQLKPEFANSIEECTDTSKLYVLPDGYIYAYMLEEVTIPGGPNYTNVADPKSADWCANSRLGSSDVSEETSGSVVTNYIPCKKDDFIRVEGLNIGYLASNANARMHYLDANKSLLGTIYPISNRTGAFVPYDYGVLGDYVSYKWDYKVGSTGDGTTYESFADKIAFVRFSGKLKTDAEHVVITVNEEITTSEPTTTKEYMWANTGRAFVPSDYEDKIIALENETNDLNDRLSDIEENGAEAGDAIPEYWVNAANVAVEKIKTKQNLAGHSCVNFIDFADMHIIHGENNYAHNVGKLSRYLMDKCDIPLAFFLGDWVNGGGESTKELMLDDVRVVKETLAPISSEELCTITGNHDLWFDGNTHTVSMEERYNAICRHNTKDFRKVFGENGSYYYVDNVPQKTRFIFLDGNWSEFTVDVNGAPSYNAFIQGGYGQNQLQFLADSLKVENGWSVCLFTHVPPISEYRPPATTPDYFRDGDILIGIINAYADKTTYSGSYDGADYNGNVRDWAKVSISVDYTANSGELIAMFTGHRHLDEVFTEPLKCPIVTVTTCGGQKIKDGYVRTYGTDTETSLDVVTINKKTRKIYCTRVGAGADREINY